MDVVGVFVNSIDNGIWSSRDGKILIRIDSRKDQKNQPV